MFRALAQLIIPIWMTKSGRCLKVR